MPPFARLALPFACLALSFCVLAGPVRAERWTFSAGAGLGTAYRISAASASGAEYDASWHVTADVARRLGEHWEVRTTAGDLHTSWRPALASAPEIRVSERLTVDFAPIGAGLRFLGTPGGHGSVLAYGEVLPALYVSRWRVQESWTGDFGFSSGSRDERVSRLLAGVMVGAGIRWQAGTHLRPELALRYHHTADPGRIRSWGTSPRGVRQLVLVASLGWAG